MSIDTPPMTPPNEPKTINDFPKPTRQHIINCGFPEWYKTYRTITGKARVIPITQGFLDYLNEDGIVLPDENADPQSTETDSGVFSSATTDDDDDDEYLDPSERFADFHATVRATIAELGGAVYPKLNWSGPKDAAFMMGNTLKCASASDVYLLLKTSNFVTHDLENVFDDTVDTPDKDGKLLQLSDIQYALVLRKWVEVITSVEFRVFVKERKIVAISQRDMNVYEFLHEGKDEFLHLITVFFDKNLKTTFPDKDFVFDVYIPKTLITEARVWLVDINPYALRTDPLTFQWTEILNMDPDEEDFEPEFRLINKNDPEAYNFASSNYSAHKLPKEVVDAGTAGPASIAEFAKNWRDIVEGLQNADVDSSSDDDDDDDNDDDEQDGNKDEKESDKHEKKTAPA
ncbi:hypothetical protein H072_321 [Dactylellina haptotyla CBS 200.50]|uniref:Uncharacterized protein n=1 Tax=Dactylellina haptotyla (strain CBS 200.50) TaxID=1284197 RepID=S8ARS8_DACHA|nr:hypothetical protein H072_321 [Dactylellina haptotyla CBS 200.50]